MAFSRYDLGQIRYPHRNVLVTSTVGSKKQDYRTINLNDIYDYDVGTVPPGYEHRPDLISSVFYGTPSFWFLLMEVNNIPDPYEGFNVGDEILIPRLQ